MQPYPLLRICEDYIAKNVRNCDVLRNQLPLLPPTILTSVHRRMSFYRPSKKQQHWALHSVHFYKLWAVFFLLFLIMLLENILFMLQNILFMLYFIIVPMQNLFCTVCLLKPTIMDIKWQNRFLSDINTRSLNIFSLYIYLKSLLKFTSCRKWSDFIDWNRCACSYWVSPPGGIRLSQLHLVTSWTAAGSNGAGLKVSVCHTFLLRMGGEVQEPQSGRNP